MSSMNSAYPLASVARLNGAQNWMAGSTPVASRKRRCTSSTKGIRPDSPAPAA